MNKKIPAGPAALLLCLLLTAALCLPASAAHVSGREAMETLETLGLLRGTYRGLEPERPATRAEAVVMLLRLLGEETAAEQAALSSPFTDGGWADAYLGYAAKHRLIRGQSGSVFGSGEAAGARDYVTMVLRALGYREGRDFTWEEALVFSDRIGLTHGEFAGDGGEAFLREDLALVSYTALTLRQRGSELRLIDSLYLRGAVSAEALMQTRLANAVYAGRDPLSASEIHETASSAVLAMTFYDSEEALQAGKYSSTGTAFLVRPEGLIFLTYHELDGRAFARATTTDGRHYDLTEVLSYDPNRDVAVARISRTDTEGETVRAFPWLDLGDSDALSPGDKVYTVSNPLELIDSVSDGLLSHRSRFVEGPENPCLQFTAPIASGSSGGPLLNAYGEVIGILFGSYVRGENMNLAIPINALRQADLDAAGVPLTEVLAEQSEKKARAYIEADPLELTLAEGEEAEVLISTDCPGSVGFSYDIDDWTIAECEWGDYITQHSIPLTVRGLQPGRTLVEVRFSYGYGNEDAVIMITVTVTGGETEEAGAAEVQP